MVTTTVGLWGNWLLRTAEKLRYYLTERGVKWVR
jgi:hypothetical protein